ncbi:unnamed protein product [Schistosoma margrebowiei]|uniref:Uncharacterized protein n=1 Tax=Schistosoma margrebowiei TaxID=48269 RepID=A0A183LVQ5_9TREM|nr:unnamed protein product [Schistosoma margrebowiei]
MPHCWDTQITTPSITITIYHVLATVTTESIPIHISFQIQYLFVIFLVTLDVICSKPQQGPSEDEVVEKFEEIKATKEFQKAKEKVIESLSDRIDKYVLDHFRKNQ